MEERRRREQSFDCDLVPATILGLAPLARHAKDFPKINTFTIDEMFGGWTKALNDHFVDGAMYDQILAGARKK